MCSFLTEAQRTHALILRHRQEHACTDTQSWYTPLISAGILRGTCCRESKSICWIDVCWGWIFLFGCCLTSSDGMAKKEGIFFVQFINPFRQCSLFRNANWINLSLTLRLFKWDLIRSQGLQFLMREGVGRWRNRETWGGRVGCGFDLGVLMEKRYTNTLKIHTD